MSRNTSELRVEDLMSRAVHTLSPEQSLPLAESMMSLHDIRHIPVVDEAQHLVGLLTHRDLLAAKISALSPLSEDERSSLQLAVPVSRIMRREVWTIAPDALAISAARIMREHRFGCLPVVEKDKLVGIISEGDLLALVTDSLSLDRPVDHREWTMARVMTRVPVTITPETTLAEARSTMSRYGIRHLPVIEKGKPISVVCEREVGIAEAIFRETERASAAHVVRLLGAPAAHRVAPDASIAVVLREMRQTNHDAVLVVDRGELVGIFTAVDACRILAESLPARAAG